MHDSISKSRLSTFFFLLFFFLFRKKCASETADLRSCWNLLYQASASVSQFIRYTQQNHYLPTEIALSSLLARLFRPFPFSFAKSIHTLKCSQHSPESKGGSWWPYKWILYSQVWLYFLYQLNWFVNLKLMQTHNNDALTDCMKF